MEIINCLNQEIMSYCHQLKEANRNGDFDLSDKLLTKLEILSERHRDEVIKKNEEICGYSAGDRLSKKSLKIVYRK